MLNPIVHPTRVDVPAIERELSQLWKSAAEPTPGAQPVTRACTLNLIACAPDSQTANRMTEAIQAITGAHPNRAIVLTNRPESATPRLDVWVQANCQLVAPGAPQVCGEQISIDAQGSAAGHVASLILALLVPDLPVALWWPGRAPFDSPLFSRLRTMADRLIVDSAGFGAPEYDLRLMADLHRERGRYALSDLSWTRLTPWRELTAQFFDSRALLPHLARLDKVTIAYERDPGQPVNRVQALLFAGWLAAALGWTPLEDSVSIESDDRVRLHLRRPAVTGGRNAIRFVTVELRPAPVVDDALDTLAAIELLALDNILARFAVERTADPYSARTSAEVAGMQPISRLVHIERMPLAAALAAELRLLSHDRTFCEALRVAGDFARGLT